MKDDIKMLVFYIDCYDDFYWNCKSFPRSIDKFGCKKDYLITYLKKPTNEDIKNTIDKILDEVEESLDPKKWKEELINEEIHNICMYLRQYGLDAINEEIDIFAYDVLIKLIDYKTEEIKFANCDDSIFINMFEFPFD